jgi:hypothetical protein
MTADDFKGWLEAMQAAGKVRTGHGHKADAAALLGVTFDRISQFEKGGTAQKQTDLACAALLAGLEPYSAGGSPP